MKLVGCLIFASLLVASYSQSSTTLTTPGENECPTGDWVDGSEYGCFRFWTTNTGNSWIDAEHLCELQGAFLAEMITEDQRNTVVSLAAVTYTLTGMSTYLIGLSDVGHEGQWVWQHSGYHLSYTDWLPNSPDTSSTNPLDCAVLSLQNGEWGWGDIDCAATTYNGVEMAPLCQRAGIPSTSVPALTTTDPMTRMELVGGNDTYGNLYVINSDGFFGPVCDDFWDDVDATVACRQLGFSSGEATMRSQWGSVNSTFAMDDVMCAGNETFLQDCTYKLFDNCGSSEGAGVICI